MRRLASIKRTGLQWLQRRARVRILAGVALLLGCASALAQPYGYSVNSRGNFPNSNDVNALWRINMATGAHERVSEQGLPTGFLDLEALAINAEDQMFGADDNLKTLVRVSKVTGIASAVGGTTTNMGLPLGTGLDFGMTFSCDDKAYVVSDVEKTLFVANTTTGELTRIGQAGDLGFPITDIAARGQDVFGIGVGLDADGNTAAPNLYRVNVSNGTAQLIGALGSSASPYNNAGLSFDAEGQLWAITDRRQVGGQDLPSQILKIDTTTGQATLVATSIVGLESLAIAPPGGCDPVASSYGIPTTTSWGLMVLTLMALSLGLSTIRRGYVT